MIRWFLSRSRRSRFALTSELPEQPDDGIVAVGHPLLERDDPVVGDVDVLGAHLGAALRDVAEAHAGLLPHELRPIAGIERVHVEAGQLDEEARPREILLLLLVVADDVADVLAQEALDALVELLDAIDVLLHHPIGAVGLRRLQAERRDLLGLLVVVRHVGDEIADQREGPDRRDADGLAGREGVHPGHAHEPRLAVDLRAARAALAGLAVPPAGQVARLGGLQAMDHVEDDHALVEVDVVGLEFTAAAIPAEYLHRDGRHHFRSWNSVRSSAGISGSASRASWSALPFCRMTTLILPQVSSVYGWSSRV